MKDEKGHGSNSRGGSTVDMTFSSKAGVGGLGKGMYARLNTGDMVKLNAAATGGRIPSVGSPLDVSQHTLVSDKTAAAVLGQGHSKSGPVPVNSGAPGRFQAKHQILSALRR